MKATESRDPMARGKTLFKVAALYSKNLIRNKMEVPYAHMMRRMTLEYVN